MRGGFNVFDTRTDKFRTYYGYGPEVEVLLTETSVNTGSKNLSLALLSLAVGSLLAAM